MKVDFLYRLCAARGPEAFAGDGRLRGLGDLTGVILLLTDLWRRDDRIDGSGDAMLDKTPSSTAPGFDMQQKLKPTMQPSTSQHVARRYGISCCVKADATHSSTRFEWSDYSGKYH